MSYSAQIGINAKLGIKADIKPLADTYRSQPYLNSNARLGIDLTYNINGGGDLCLFGVGKRFGKYSTYNDGLLQKLVLYIKYICIFGYIYVFKFDTCLCFDTYYGLNTQADFKYP